MNIILLSGGSGQRLWPLSNQKRSKQFLRLLDNGKGGMESMIQRVVRQIRESGLDAALTLATNEGQKELILEQLGNDVGIVLEPERRDTFPAIALACSYLSLERGLPDDETVIVMPCDPYTESGYFETIGKMAEAARNDAAKLVLMGITPTYASVKFGYVVPEGRDGDLLPVSGFTEKPEEKRAAELLEAGAFWNGGVFAFKLGYLMEKLRRYVKADSYGETVSRYCEFPKISFDYEVAEKEESVAVVPFKGVWKDLGTWNSLAETISGNTIGNVHLGPDCENVHGINETGLPVFIDGVRDIVVAVSPDGILVCGKDAAENIKNHVGDLKVIDVRD